MNNQSPVALLDNCPVECPLSHSEEIMAVTTIRKAIYHTPAAVVFGVAAWQSYWHTVEVATRYGEHDTAYLLPLSIDGLMVVAARYVSNARTRIGRILATGSFTVGVSAMLASNYLAADENPFSRAVAVWPALAMVLVAAMLHWSPQRSQAVQKPMRRRPAKRTPAKAVTPPKVTPPVQPEADKPPASTPKPAKAAPAAKATTTKVAPTKTLVTVPASPDEGKKNLA